MANTPTFISENKEFFKAVDNESMKLRAVANDLATLLTGIKNPPTEIHSLIEAAKSVKTMDIEQLDVVFNQLRDAMTAVNSKMQEKEFIGAIPLQKIMGMTQKENELANEACLLIRKADKMLVKK